MVLAKRKDRLSITARIDVEVIGLHQNDKPSAGSLDGREQKLIFDYFAPLFVSPGPFEVLAVGAVARTLGPWPFSCIRPAGGVLPLYQIDKNEYLAYYRNHPYFVEGVPIVISSDYRTIRRPVRTVRASAKISRLAREIENALAVCSNWHLKSRALGGYPLSEHLL